MKKALLLAAFLALFAVGASALACTETSGNCNEKTSVKQKITVKIPAVVKLVIDGNASGDKWLPEWTVNLKAAEPDLSNCYVIPNWVGFDGQETLNQFLQAANASNGNLDGLVPAESSYGYPPVIRRGGTGAVATWDQVSAANYTGSPYLKEAPGSTSEKPLYYPAKGNLVCTNSVMVEKYTNCPNVAFFVRVVNHSGDGFGSLFMTDAATISGVEGSGNYVGGSGFKYFHPVPMNTLVPLLTGGTAEGGGFNGIPRGVWIDDNITQLLWLKNSTSGNYHLTATYTLGTALKVGYSN